MGVRGVAAGVGAGSHQREWEPGVTSGRDGWCSKKKVCLGSCLDPWEGGACRIPQRVLCGEGFLRSPPPRFRVTLTAILTNCSSVVRAARCPRVLTVSTQLECEVPVESECDVEAGYLVTRPAQAFFGARCPGWPVCNKFFESATTRNGGQRTRGLVLC